MYVICLFLAKGALQMQKTGKWLDSLWQRANTWNASFQISLWWLIHIINPVDKTKLSSPSAVWHPAYWANQHCQKNALSFIGFTDKLDVNCGDVCIGCFLIFAILIVCRLTPAQNCMKLSGTIEMTVAEFFVNLTFAHQREGLLLSTVTDIIN